MKDEPLLTPPLPLLPLLPHSMAEVVKMLQVARTSPNWQKFDKVERDRYSGLCGCFSFS